MIRHAHRRRKMPRSAAARVGNGCYYLDEITLLNSGGIVIGDNVGFARDCWLNGFGGITIDDNTIIGPGVYIHSANHEVKRGRVVRTRWVAKSVWIGANVWIGAGAIILPGAYIEDDTIVGAGSVVAGHVRGVVHGEKARGHH